MRLEPQPNPQELSRYYPPAYWFRPEATPASYLEELYRRIVLWDHVQFALTTLQQAPADGIILDVGCGGGLFARMLAQASRRTVIGLDYSLDAGLISWHVNGVPTICGTLTSAPLQPGSCAMITMFHILEHLYDPRAYLEAARELLMPGGRLIVQVPNAASWQCLLFGHRWNGVDAPRHLILFRDTDLEFLLTRCGFHIARKKYFSLRDNPAGFATSVATDLDPMARRVRGYSEGHLRTLVKDLLYFGLVLLAFPFCLMEAAAGAGSTVMFDAVKR